MEVHSGCYEIWRLEYPNIGAAETSAQVCGRLQEQLRPQHRSAGDFKSSWDLITSSAGDLMPYSHTSGSEHSTTTRHFVGHIRLCYSHKICYIIIWHVLSMSLYIYTYGDTGITEIDSATGSIYLDNPGVDRHHPILKITHSIFPNTRSHALLPSFHRSKQFVQFIMVGIASYPLTLFVRSSSQNRLFSQIPFGYHARCARVLMTECLRSSSSILQHHEVSLEMHSEAVIERVWRYTWRL